MNLELHQTLSDISKTIKNSVDNEIVCNCLKQLVSLTNDENNSSAARDLLRADPEFIREVLCSILGFAAARCADPSASDIPFTLRIDTMTLITLLIRNLAQRESTRNALLCDRIFLSYFFGCTDEHAEEFPWILSFLASDFVREQNLEKLSSSSSVELLFARHATEELQQLVHAYLDALYALTSIREGDPVRSNLEILHGDWIGSITEIAIYFFDDCFLTCEDAGLKWSKTVLQFVLGDRKNASIQASSQSEWIPRIRDTILKILSHSAYANDNETVETIFFIIYNLIFPSNNHHHSSASSSSSFLACSVFGNSRFLDFFDEFLQKRSAGIYLKNAHREAVPQLMELLKQTAADSKASGNSVSDVMYRFTSLAKNTKEAIRKLGEEDFITEFTNVSERIFSFLVEENSVERNEIYGSERAKNAPPLGEKVGIRELLRKAEFFDAWLDMSQQSPILKSLPALELLYRLIDIAVSNDSELRNQIATCTSSVKDHATELQRFTFRDMFSVVGHKHQQHRHLLPLLHLHSLSISSLFPEDSADAALVAHTALKSNSPFVEFFHSIVQQYLRDESIPGENIKSSNTLFVINRLLTNLCFLLDKCASFEETAFFFYGGRGESAIADFKKDSSSHPFVRDLITLLEFAAAHGDHVTVGRACYFVGALYFHASGVEGRQLYMNERLLRLVIGSMFKLCESWFPSMLVVIYLLQLSGFEEGEVLLRNKFTRDALVVGLKKRNLSSSSRSRLAEVICNLSDEPEECQEIFATRIMRDALLGAIVRPCSSIGAKVTVTARWYYQAILNIFSDGAIDSLELFCKSPLIVDAFLQPFALDLYEDDESPVPTGCSLIRKLMGCEEGKRLFCARISEFEAVAEKKRQDLEKQQEGTSSSSEETAMARQALDELVKHLKEENEKLPLSLLAKDSYISPAAAVQIRHLESKCLRVHAAVVAEKLSHQKTTEALKQIQQRLGRMFGKN